MPDLNNTTAKKGIYSVHEAGKIGSDGCLHLWRGIRDARISYKPEPRATKRVDLLMREKTS